MQTQAIATPLLLPLPVELFYGLPYGVRGLCRTWQSDNFSGRHIRRPPAAYRATMVVNTYFGNWRV